MSRAPKLMAVPVALAVVAGLVSAAPALAAGGPPTIVSLTPGSLPADGTLTIVGSGCDAGSPVSFRLFNTAVSSDLDVDSADTGWWPTVRVRSAARVDVDNALAPGEIGVLASCTSTYDFPSASNPVSDDSYFILTAADPVVTVAVAAQAPYGSAPTVTVTTRRATGMITLELDGAVVHTAGSASGGTSFALPAGLAVGSHTLKATFDEAPVEIAGVVDTASVAIVKATPVLTAKPVKRKVRLGKKAKITVVLGTGAAPATGKVQIKEGKKVRKTVTLGIANHGTKVVKVKLRAKGKHKLRAVYLGNAYASPVTSRKVTIKVI